ncbi:MAG: efflux RND transporter periplasmic adaptor subunit, partial [Acidobacteria bacterium]|nr:efflux RND transporter periplasmic adaptor subunit [Acidobacteriota bacterium]
TVTPRTVALDVHAQGTVRPRTETTLVAEVAAKVVDLSPAFARGGFFEPGEVLVRLDPRSFELAVTGARAEVARAQVALERELAEAELAAAEWRDLGKAGAPPPLVAHEPQTAQARAAVAAAQASLERAQLDLDRATVRAPYAGRVRDKQADLGQFVTPGQPLGRIYAVDYAEVELPVPDAQLAFLDLPLAFRGEGATGRGPEVTLSAVFAGAAHTWPGRIVRTGGEIDAKSRMVGLVARVDDPYGRHEDPDRPPLAVGLFVEATIAGREVPDVVVLPRVAMRGDDRVLVLDGGDRLRYRPVEVLRRQGEEVLVAKGLSAGDRVCVSPLEAPVDGMRVRATETAP